MEFPHEWSDGVRITLTILIVGFSLSMMATVVMTTGDTRLDTHIDVESVEMENGLVEEAHLRASNPGLERERWVIRMWSARDHRQHVWNTPNRTQPIVIDPGETMSIHVERNEKGPKIYPTTRAMVVIVTPDGTKRNGTVFVPNEVTQNGT